MFQSNFIDELSTRVGSAVEVATNNSLIEGIITAVSSGFVVVLGANDGYGDSSRTFVPVSSINFARFSQTA